jgi:hypothetical protein
MKTIKNYLLPVLITAFFSSCHLINEEAEKRLNELKDKTESLDSLINKEVDKVLALDSLINTETDKVKKLDSIINESTSKLDSISNEKVRVFKKILE